MTDRYYALTVALEGNFRDDDIEPLMTSIKMLRGVLEVTGEKVYALTYTALERARSQLGEKIIDVIYPKESE